MTLPLYANSAAIPPTPFSLSQSYIYTPEVSAASRSAPQSPGRRREVLWCRHRARAVHLSGVLGPQLEHGEQDGPVRRRSRPDRLISSGQVNRRVYETMRDG